MSGCLEHRLGGTKLLYNLLCDIVMTCCVAGSVCFVSLMNKHIEVASSCLFDGAFSY